MLIFANRLTLKDQKSMNVSEVQPNISSQKAIDLEYQYGAHNYKPLPVVISRGEGVHVWDVEGNKYYDFLAAYSALNQGHCHPDLVAAVKDQVEKVTLTSRAFHNDWLGPAEEYLATTFGYHKVLMMNSGAEGVETAIKLARRWAYQVKGIQENQAKIVVARENFHGRTSGIISFSNDEDATKDFGPFMPGFIAVDYNDTAAVEEAFNQENVAGFLVEPIQGEGGVIIPDDGYHSTIRDLCNKYNVLYIGDEIQTGLGRTGSMLYLDQEEVRPDILILGKALSGGMLPVSAVLANDEVMMTLQPGTHGSTFGGNPLGARVSVEAIRIILEEKLSENARKMGEEFRERVNEISNPGIKEIRGKGLMNAIEFYHDKLGETAYDVCKKLKDHGLLAKQTRDNTIRFTPPLIITRDQIIESCEIIEKVLSN